jgi:hypothetical protein
MLLIIYLHIFIFYECMLGNCLRDHYIESVKVFMCNGIRVQLYIKICSKDLYRDYYVYVFCNITVS